MRAISPSVPTRDQDQAPPCPTAPEDVNLRRLRRSRAWRRGFTVLLVLFLVGAVTGAWGVREASTEASAQGWTLKATYPSVTRAGLAVPLEWEIRRDGGFGGEDATVVLRMTSGYMELFDENSFGPTPSTEWSDGTHDYWEFDAPPGGDTMAVSVDTRTGSAVQLTSRSAEAAVLVDGAPVVTVRFRTWVMP